MKIVFEDIDQNISSVVGLWAHEIMDSRAFNRIGRSFMYNPGLKYRYIIANNNKMQGR